MANTILAIALALALGNQQPGAGSAQAPPIDVGQGRVAWFDITTSDLARSQSFYAQLFGWKFTPVEGTSQAVEIVSHDTPVGTLRTAEGQISATNGVVYIQVNDIRWSCAKAAELGGTVVPGFPFDLSDGRGSIGLVLDPSGHPVGMYSSKLLAASSPGR